VNNESIVFIGGPLDRKYFPDNLSDETFVYKYEKNNEYCEAIYRRTEYPWKNNTVAEVMMWEGLPKQYQNLISRAFRQGVTEHLTLGSIILCLPGISDSPLM